ncbi:transposable element Tcb1 transposase [Trichonephila clavipes]|nr:transposable element Tcb1 transposase [Trichonephila clavipes]
MGKAANLSDFDRGQIVMARRLGTSISETARVVGFSRSIVETVSHGEAKPEPDSGSVDTQYNVGPSRTVSEHTVQRTLLRSKRPTLVPLLTKRHRQLRLRWAREHHDWSMDQWERVAWSDESRFVIRPADGRTGYAVFQANSCSLNVQ